jgi:two-component system, NtrC family, nitrogen regulation response regulator GlnG
MRAEAPVWIIDDDKAIRFVLERALQDAGFNTQSFAAAADASQALQNSARPALVFTDIHMPGQDGLSWLKQARKQLPDLAVVVMSAYTDLSATIAAFEGGAIDYLPKPFDLHQAIAFAERSRARVELPAPTREAKNTFISGKSAAMAEIFRAIGRVARTELTVLITGETGTGKELIARALHQHSARASQAFVALNTAAIAPELLESELFGHEQGAFTGAHRRHAGRFEQAEGGTLFLDEIGDMPLALQTRLLRVLAEGEYFPLGGRDLKRANVRLLAATHQDLQSKVARGEFRADLLHRLNVVEIRVPALRDRLSDLPELADLLLDAAALELKMPRKRLSAEALQHFHRYAWPGNVRELRNACLRLTALVPGREIQRTDVEHLLPLAAVLPAQSHTETSAEADLWQQLAREAGKALAAGERNIYSAWHAALDQSLFDAALAHSQQDRQKAAKLLGIGRNTLGRKLGPRQK